MFVKTDVSGAKKGTKRSTGPNANVLAPKEGKKTPKHFLLPRKKARGRDRDENIQRHTEYRMLSYTRDITKIRNIGKSIGP